MIVFRLMEIGSGVDGRDGSVVSQLVEDRNEKVISDICRIAFKLGKCLDDKSGKE